MQLVSQCKQLEIWTNIWNNILIHWNDDLIGLYFLRGKGKPFNCSVFLSGGRQVLDYLPHKKKEAKQNMRIFFELKRQILKFGRLRLMGFAREIIQKKITFFLRMTMCIYIQWLSFFWLNINLHIHRMKHHKAKKNQLQRIYRPHK